MLKYFLCAVAALYALLSMAAAAVQLRAAGRKDTPLLMGLGSLCILSAAVLEAAAWAEGWPVMLLGSACVCAAAFLNGRRSGHFHLEHHVIRFAFTLLLVFGFYML